MNVSVPWVPHFATWGKMGSLRTPKLFHRLFRSKHALVLAKKRMLRLDSHKAGSLSKWQKERFLSRRV
jgi:hypothetical protein